MLMLFSFISNGSRLAANRVFSTTMSCLEGRHLPLRQADVVGLQYYPPLLDQFNSSNLKPDSIGKP